MPDPEAPFDEPWQAQVFAMTVALNEAGRFTWSEWAAVFGPRVQTSPVERYWDIWVEALVTLLQDRGLAESDHIGALTKRWQDAARATPHGVPIRLHPGDG